MHCATLDFDASHIGVDCGVTDKNQAHINPLSNYSLTSKIGAPNQNSVTSTVPTKLHSSAFGALNPESCFNENTRAPWTAMPALTQNQPFEKKILRSTFFMKWSQSYTFRNLFTLSFPMPKMLFHRDSLTWKLFSETVKHWCLQ